MSASQPVSFIIRAATMRDLPAVVTLERSIPEAAHWPEQEYAAMLQSTPEATVQRCILIAEQQGALVGYAVGKVLSIASEVSAELENLAVATSARRQGIGYALCEAVVGWCRDHQAAELELEVRISNAAAIHMYEQLGFRRTALRRGYYLQPPEDALLMKLHLQQE
ncbi:MAG: ribosomal protein S18-alanine N-acetyltransferase [Acidobacteriaceae bacterium]